jgi:hypothetical protein
MYRPVSHARLAGLGQDARGRCGVRAACAITGALFSLTAGSAGVEIGQRTVSPPPAPASLVAGAAPLELAAVEQPGTPPTDERTELRFVAGASTNLDLSWVVRSANRGGLLARVEVENAWCAVDRQYPIRAANWAFGGLYAGRYAFRVPPFTLAGPGVVRVWIADTVAGGPSIEVSRFPCWIEPAVVASTFDERIIRRRFGESAYALRKACRLFPGAAVEIPIETARARAYSGIAVVSCVRYDATLRQGAPVLEIEVESEDGSHTERVTLNAGIHTSLGEIDAARPGVVKIKRAEIAALLPYPGVSWKGEPIALHQYLGQCALSRPIAPGQIRLRQIAEAGAVDVFEIVLLAAGPDRDIR